MSSRINCATGMYDICCIEHTEDRTARLTMAQHGEPLMYGTSVQFMQRVVHDGVMLYVHNVVSNKVNKPISYIIKLLSYCNEIDRSQIYEYDRQEFNRGGYVRLGGHGGRITTAEKNDSRTDLLCEQELKLESVSEGRTSTN